MSVRVAALGLRAIGEPAELATYYFFVLGDQGHVKAREQHDCIDDTDAINTARVNGADHDVEVWCGALRIGTVRKDGSVERSRQ